MPSVFSLSIAKFLEASGYAAVTWTTDVKIVLGTIAVAAALYSHFNKQEYPDNKYIVLGCVMIYMVCVAITTCIGTFIEGNSVFMATPTKRAQKMGRLAKIPLIRTFSSFPKHGQSVYLLTFKKGKKIGGGKAEDNERAAKMSYEKYFTSEGEFLATKFRKDVAELLNSLGTAKKSQ